MTPAPYIAWAVMATILTLGAIGVAAVAVWFAAAVLGSWRRPRVERSRFLPEVFD